MVNNEKIPYFCRVVLQNFPFIEEDFDALTTYGLVSKVVEYLNKVIKSQNTLVDNVNNLSLAFQQLHDYVEHYFDNLDVQEEINNKLDQMAEDGTLQEIITAYIQANVIWTFDTVADMKLSENLITGSYAQTLGFHTLNDGGGATYYITDTGTANEMDVIAVGDLYAVLTNPKNVKQYGAYGDDTNDDSANIQRAISANYHGSIHFPVGEYVITTPINITSSINITGEGIYSVLVKKDTSAYNASINYDNVPFNFNDYPSIFNAVFPTDSNLTYLKINGLRFTEDVTGQTKAIYAIVAPHLTYSAIQNCRFSNLNTCLILGGWCDTVKKCEFFTSTVALDVKSSFNFINNEISECYFNNTYSQIKNAHNSSLNNCQGDSSGVPYVFVDCNSISMINCSTEAWSESVRADNSFVTLQNCDLELHDKDNYTAFITATNGAIVNASDSYIHYEDYSAPGEYPTNTNIVTNSGGSTIKIKNCKISIPFTYKDYISGSGVNEINDYVHSNLISVPNKVSKQITSGTSVEIMRLPLGYNKRAQVKVKGYASDTSVVSMNIDSSIVAMDRVTGTNPSDYAVQTEDNTIFVSTTAPTMTVGVAGSYDTDTRELVIAFTSSANYHYSVYLEIEYNLI